MAMRRAIELADFKNKIYTKEIPSGWDSFTRETTVSLSDHNYFGYVLTDVFKYSDGSILKSLPYYFQSIDVFEDGEFDNRNKQFLLPERILYLLVDNSVPHICLYDFKYMIQYWTTTNAFINHGIDTPKELNNERATALPVQEFEIIYGVSHSKHPVYLDRLADVNVGMIKTPPKTPFNQTE